MRILTIAFCVVGSVLLSQCTSSTTDNVTTDIVKNPKTASGAVDSQKFPLMKFDTVVQDFGTITQGESVTKVFKFTNTGEADLIITSARGTCGCTVPTFPRKPIAPGGKGEIEVVFNSENKAGTQHKNVYIIANTPEAKNTITIRGKVLTPANN